MDKIVSKVKLLSISFFVSRPLRKYSHPVADFHDFIEFVGDKKNTVAVGLHPAKNFNELFDLLGDSEGMGGVVLYPGNFSSQYGFLGSVAI